MRNLLLMTAMLGLVGCVGGLEGTDPTPPDNEPTNPNPTTPPAVGTAAQMYEDTVYPIMTNASAACGSCHTEGALAGGAPASSGFVGPSKTGSYQVLLGYPNVHGNFAANAKILSYVTLTAHQGKSYTVDEVATINAWLATALAETNNDPTGNPTGPEGPGVVTERVLGTFSACMTQADFDLAEMADACGDMNATNNQQCENCHVNGGDGFIASRQSSAFFETFSTNRAYMQKYFQVANAENPTMAKIDRNMPMFAAVLNRQGQYLEHPAVNNPTNNQCTQAMLQFQGLVQAKIDANAAACGPSKLID